MLHLLSNNMIPFVIFLLLYSFEHCSTSQSTNVNIFSDYRQHLSTKTPYSFIGNLDDSEIKFSGCEATKIWAIFRHGTRTAGLRIALKMKEKLTMIQKLLLENSHKSDIMKEPILSQLRNWRVTFNESENKLLTHEGEEELLLLGERYLNRFPKLLHEHYNNNTYRFKFTQTQRTEESAKSFAIGLFGRKESSYIWYPEPLRRDPILRFYKLCQKWKYDVKKNPLTMKEVELFRESDTLKKPVKKFSDDLGLDQPLTVADCYEIFVACAFETAWAPKRDPSPWCSILPLELFKAYEYMEDMEYYYKDGHGYKVNGDQACVALRDMVEHILNPEDPTASFYFTHSGTLLKLIAHLRLYKDKEPLLHNTTNFHKRKWRTSKIDAFATNLAFIHYSCGDEGDKLLTLHQERPVILPGCPTNTPLCPLEMFLDNFADSINCEFDSICSLGDPKVEL